MIRKIIAENAIYRSDAITGTFLKNGYDEMGLPWSNVYISFCGDKKKTKIAEFAIHESSCKASDMCHELIPDLLMKATIDAVVMNEKEWIEICAYNLQISAYDLQNIELHIFADTNGFHIQNFISVMCFFGEHCSDKFLKLLQEHLNDIALFDFQTFTKGLQVGKVNDNISTVRYAIMIISKGEQNPDKFFNLNSYFNPPKI